MCVIIIIIIFSVHGIVFLFTLRGCFDLLSLPSVLLLGILMSRTSGFLSLLPLCNILSIPPYYFGILKQFSVSLSLKVSCAFVFLPVPPLFLMWLFHIFLPMSVICFLSLLTLVYILYYFIIPSSSLKLVTVLICLLLIDFTVVVESFYSSPSFIL